MQKISIGSDHGGYELKLTVKEILEKRGYEIHDMGCNSPESCDYPDYGFAVANEVSSGKSDKGILICKSGIGMSIVANKVKDIRAALCYTAESAGFSRMHNDANILVMGSKYVKPEVAEDILFAFLNTEFEGGRHTKRVDKIKLKESC
ncbi:MAG: hypothetical protein ACD_79C00304G0007 [uncultured bacterium]|nr:MAG: hypothetical protein ACD_79C00304G0007 [uncultured bacterium]